MCAFSTSLTTTVFSLDAPRNVRSCLARRSDLDPGCGRAGWAGLPGFSTSVPVGPVGGLVGSGRSEWCQGGLEQLGPGLLPRPVLRKVHPEAAGGAGQPSRDVDQLGADGTGGGFGVEGRG